MRRDLQQIPPAPRLPRWPVVLWVRWPLAFLAFALAVYGGVITLMLFHAESGRPSEDLALDHAGVHAEGELTSVSLLEGSGGSPRWWVAYRFRTPDGSVHDGEVSTDHRALHPGEAHDVVYLPQAPHVNRLVGTRLSWLARTSGLASRLVVLPGVLCGLLWLWSVLRARHLLRKGDVASAELLEVRLVGFVIPEMLRVTFRFRDRSARFHVGRHWVRARSLLGTRLTTLPPPTEAPVVHDRTRPRRCRLVCADDFVRATADACRDDAREWMPKS